MTALTADELLAWVERTADGWRRLLDEHPDVLTLPCDIRESKTVADLVQHIVAVELRYAERISGLPETSYDALPRHSADLLFATHTRAVEMFRMQLTAQDAAWWEQTISFTTRRGGCLSATRRTILVHALTHSIRHYAQLATLVRRHGIAPDWPMDYLFMAATLGQGLPQAGPDIHSPWPPRPYV